jgi:ribosomal protein L37E
MAPAIVIAIIAACCIACGYGISRALRRSKQQRGESLHAQ